MMLGNSDSHRRRCVIVVPLPEKLLCLYRCGSLFGPFLAYGVTDSFHRLFILHIDVYLPSKFPLGIVGSDCLIGDCRVIPVEDLSADKCAAVIAGRLVNWSSANIDALGVCAVDDTLDFCFFCGPALSLPSCPNLDLPYRLRLNQWLSHY